MVMRSPKPGHWSAGYAQMFKDQSVVDDYRLRPAYVSETFSILAQLMIDQEPRRVLDAGCGTGNLARGLVQVADQVDAVDYSVAAIKQGRELPGGDSPRLRWINNPMEKAPLNSDYALITAASSLHWMDWYIVMPLFSRHLQPGASLALVENVIEAPPWAAEVGPIIADYSLNKEFQPYDNRTVARNLSDRGLFRPLGEQKTPTIPLSQSVAAYITSFHSRNGLSRDRLGQQLSAEFHDRMMALVAPYCPSGAMTLNYYSRVIWGQPLSNS